MEPKNGGLAVGEIGPAGTPVLHDGGTSGLVSGASSGSSCSAGAGVRSGGAGAEARVGPGRGLVHPAPAPLRRIVEVVRPASDLFGKAAVVFECGHSGQVSSGAIYKGRCRLCRPAEPSCSSASPAPTPIQPDPVR